jgi:HEPN domain-containing protein
LLAINIDAWGYSLVHLFRRWDEEQELSKNKEIEPSRIEKDLFLDLFEKCQELDRHYIQPRYPNGFSKRLSCRIL